MKRIAKQFAIIACGVLLLAGCSTMPRAKMWEYKTLTTLNQDGEAQLNRLGKDGWKLAGFSYAAKNQTSMNDEYHYVFERPTK